MDTPEVKARPPRMDGRARVPLAMVLATAWTTRDEKMRTSWVIANRRTDQRGALDELPRMLQPHASLGDALRLGSGEPTVELADGSALLEALDRLDRPHRPVRRQHRASLDQGNQRPSASADVTSQRVGQGSRGCPEPQPVPVDPERDLGLDQHQQDIGGTHSSPSSQSALGCSFASDG